MRSKARMHTERAAYWFADILFRTRIPGLTPTNYMKSHKDQKFEGSKYKGYDSWEIKIIDKDGNVSYQTFEIPDYTNRIGDKAITVAFLTGIVLLNLIAIIIFAILARLL